MKKNLFLISSLLLSVLLTEAVELTPVSADEILFLAHFDESLTPDIGFAEGADCQARLTESGQGFPFKGTGPRKSLDLTHRGKYRYYQLPQLGNFDADQGTIQMWILPQWKKGSYAMSVFFHQLTTIKDWADYFNYHQICMFKAGNKEVFKCLQGDHGGGREIPIPTDGGKDGWIQLAMTWDKKTRQRCFYVNGELQDTQSYRRNTTPEAIMLGCAREHSARCFMDEVRILNRAMTAPEIKQDYQANLEGKPFANPLWDGKSDISF